MLAIAILAEVARLGLWVAGIFQCVSTVWNANLINVKSEILALAEMNDTFVRPSPVATKVGLIFIVPNNPAATFEERHRRDFDICQNF